MVRYECTTWIEHEPNVIKYFVKSVSTVTAILLFSTTKTFYFLETIPRGKFKNNDVTLRRGLQFKKKVFFILSLIA